MDEFAIFRDYYEAVNYQRRDNETWYERIKNAEPLEGYVHFGGGQKVAEDEPESELPF